MWFTQGYIDFFKELAANNHKDWFHANKKRYENEVKKPFHAFIQELLDRTGYQVPLKNTLFRINRDIRFSKDKNPYKTFMSAVISDAGRKNMQIPGLYVHLEIGNVMIGGGAHMPDKENLHKIRSAIANDPKRVDRILNKKSFTDYYNGLAASERNKILPKEFKALGQSIPLLFNKQYYFMAVYEKEDVILKDDLVEFVLAHHKAGAVWNGFILEALAS